MCMFRSVSDLLQHFLEIKENGNKLFASTLFLKNASTLRNCQDFGGAGRKFSGDGILDLIPEGEGEMASSRCLVENLQY